MSLKAFTRLHCRFYGWIVFLSLVGIVSGLYFAQGLGLDTDLKSLLPKDSPSVVGMDVISPKTGGNYDIQLVISGGPIEARLAAIKDFSQFLLTQDNYVRSLFFETPKPFFEKHKYQFIPSDVLENLLDRVERERRKNKDLTDPLGLEEVIEKEEGVPTEDSAVDQEEDEDQMDLAKELLDQIEEMKPFYTTDDGQYIALRVVPRVESLNLGANEAALDQFQLFLSDFDFEKFHPDIETYVNGGIYRQIEKVNSIKSDASVGGWGILVIFVVLTFFFSSAWPSLILFPPLILGLSVGLSIVDIFEAKLNTISAFLILVAFGVGVEFGVHLWARMIQERKRYDLEESLYRTWKETGRATVTSAVALLAGFALVSLSSFQGFAQFGRVAMILLACIAGSFLLVMPSWVVLVERLRRSKDWPPSLADRAWIAAVNEDQKGKVWIPKWAPILRVASVFLFFGGVILCLTSFGFDYHFGEGFKERRKSEQELALKEIFSERLKPSAVTVFADVEEAFELTEFYRKNKAEFPDIAFVSSLSTFYPSDQDRRLDLLQEISDAIEPSWLKNWEDEKTKEALIEIQETAYDMETYSLEDVPTQLKESFLAADRSGDQLVFLYDIDGETDGRKAIRFSNDVENLLKAANLEPVMSGPAIIFADIVQRVLKEGPWLIVGMFILVFLICWIDFKALKYAVLCTSPVLFGFVLTGAVLVIFNIKLNFYNMLAFASLGSMVVDNCIHLYHRYLHSLQTAKGSAARYASYSTIPTIVTCTMTSICGYGGMLFAAHNGIRSLGTVAVVGLVCCLVSSCVFFPAWLNRREETQSKEGLEQTKAQA